MASAALMCSTVGLALAANYPQPFENAGTAAVVWGSNAANTDIAAATSIMTDLQSVIGSGTTSSGGTTTISGENFPLFTGSSELFLNSTLSSVRSTLTDAELPLILEDGTFEGVSSVQYTQKIDVGGTSQIVFAEMPTSSDDPQVGISLGTNPSTQQLYNATVVFESNVNFTHADSSGEDIDLFGQRFTVGAGTTASKLVLLKSSETIDLSSENPTATISVEGSEYIIELVSATDSSATIKVTDSSGSTDRKEINEHASKKISGVEVSVDLADENNQRISASVSIGSNKIVLQDGTAVKIGSDEDTIDGTQVEFILANGTETTYTGVIGKLIFSMGAPDSDHDAIFPGEVFVDPVFGSFKFDFTGISIPLDDTTDRETILVSPSSNDKMNVNFRSYESSEPKTVNWVYNKTTSEAVTEGAGLGGMILGDSDGDPIRVMESSLVNGSQYVVIANDNDGGGLYEVTQIKNTSSTVASDDYVTLKNIFTGESNNYPANSEGSITAVIQGKTYTIEYTGVSTLAKEAMQARFNSPDSSSNDVILFPGIKTHKGAKVAFYQPTLIDLENFNGISSTTRAGNITSLLLPDGDGYTDVDVARDSGGGDINGGGVWNFTFGSTTRSVNTTAKQNSSGALTVGSLTYNITGGIQAVTATNHTVIYLQNPEGGNIVRPALIIFQEKDDASTYGASIVTLDAGYDGSNNDIGVADIVRTWSADSGSVGTAPQVGLGQEIQLESDSDLYQDMDLWGTLYTLDKSDTDQAIATVSYPDEQVEAMVYVAEQAATVDDDPVTSLGVVLVKDSEVSSVSSKNLVVVGGSCVNTVAAELLGSTSPLCGSSFTAETQVGSGQFLIESFNSKWSSGKVAVLVAGYNAQDTENAATYLRTQDVDTTVGMKYIGTTATQATLQTSS